MCKSFLEIYSCTDFDCRHKLENLGLTGAGFAFQDMASAIEKASRDPAFLLLKVNLKREEQLNEELIASGGSVPRDLEDKWFPSLAPWKDEEESRHRDRGRKGLVRYNKY